MSLFLFNIVFLFYMANKQSGIYTITNLLDGKLYVGHAVDCLDRKRRHFQSLIKGTHHSCLLQRSVNKYGIDNFKFEILEEYPLELLIAMEHYWATILDTHNPKYGYNIKPTSPIKIIGKGHKFKHTKEALIARSLNYKEDPKRILHAQKMAKKGQIANKGLKRTKQQVLNIIQGVYKDGRTIDIFSLNKEFIINVASQKEASVFAGISKAMVHKCINGKSKRGGKYIFKYKFKD